MNNLTNNPGIVWLPYIQTLAATWSGGEIILKLNFIMEKIQCLSCGWIGNPIDKINPHNECEEEDRECPECGEAGNMFLYDCENEL